MDDSIDVNTPSDPELTPEVSETPEGGKNARGEEVDVPKEGDDTSDELFNLTNLDKLNEWQVESKLAEYFNSNARTFIPTKTLKERILDDCPVPTNIAKLPVLDKAIKKVIPEASVAIGEDKKLSEVWESIRNISAPQLQLWQEIEGLKRLIKSAKSNSNPDSED